MDIFSSFPNAIISTQYELGQLDRGTVVGNQFSDGKLCSVIVDEGSFTVTNRSPDAEYEDSDILIYARPSEMPTLVTAQLTNGYMWHDVVNDLYYEIREASLGKNQETGQVEHVEFLVRPTEVANNDEE